MTLTIRPAIRMKHIIERMNSRPDINLRKSGDYVLRADGCKVEQKCAVLKKRKQKKIILLCTFEVSLWWKQADDTFIKKGDLFWSSHWIKTELQRLHFQKPEYSVFLVFRNPVLLL